jgi:tellurite resistance protein TerC
MDISLTIWVITVGAIIGFILLDLFTVSANPHEVKFKEAAGWSLLYIHLAIFFGIWIWFRYGSQSGTEFFAAYLVEKSLSVDNLFVFAIILTQFAVPSIYQQRVLLFGVILALVLEQFSLPSVQLPLQHLPLPS